MSSHLSQVLIILIYGATMASKSARRYQKSKIMLKETKWSIRLFFQFYFIMWVYNTFT